MPRRLPSRGRSLRRVVRTPPEIGFSTYIRGFRAKPKNGAAACPLKKGKWGICPISAHFSVGSGADHLARGPLPPPGAGQSPEHPQPVARCDVRRRSVPADREACLSASPNRQPLARPDDGLGRPWRTAWRLDLARVQHPRSHVVNQDPRVPPSTGDLPLPMPPARVPNIPPLYLLLFLCLQYLLALEKNVESFKRLVWDPALSVGHLLGSLMLHCLLHRLCSVCSCCNPFVFGHGVIGNDVVTDVGVDVLDVSPAIRATIFQIEDARCHIAC